MTLDPPAVSVVLCTYNGGRYLREQLASIGKQTMPPCEVLVGDDCSSDDTQQIVDEFAGRAPFPVRFIRNPTQLGYSENFLTTAAQSRGDLISFSDQDDIWAPKKLEYAVRGLLVDNALLCAHNVELMQEDGTPTGILGGLETDRVVSARTRDPWGNYYGFTIVFRRELLDCFDASARGPDPITGDNRLPHDRWFYFLATSLGDVVELSTPLAQYRQHGRQLFGAHGTRTTRQRVTHLLRASLSQIENHRDSAIARCATLRSADSPSELIDPDQVQAAGLLWARIAHRWSQRAEIYTLETLQQRARAIHSLLRDGAYRRAVGGEHLSLTNLAQDLLFGVVLTTVRPWQVATDEPSDVQGSPPKTKAIRSTDRLHPASG